MKYNHQKDVVYGYKDGMALVMDIYSPNDSPNNAGIIWVAAGGFHSEPAYRHEALSSSGPLNFEQIPRMLLDSGYVVFATSHSTQPRYTIDEIRPDIPRAVRFVRHNAENFGIDPLRIGIIGGSSGGYTSLMTALAPPSADQEAEDLVDRLSSQVQAVVAYFPPTDLLNYGDENTLINGYLKREGLTLNAPFDFQNWSETEQRFERIIDPEELLECYGENSPIAHVNSDNPPVLLIHGDKDRLAPIQQSQLLAARLSEAGVKHKLITVPGMEHVWPTPTEGGLDAVNGWFNEHLLKKT